MFVPNDLPGVDVMSARRLLVTARLIAPCLDTLESDARMDALAILQGVASRLPEPGMERVRTQSRNGTSVGLDPFTSAFTAEDRAALRALCGTAASPGQPVGSFPLGRVADHIWPPEDIR